MQFSRNFLHAKKGFTLIEITLLLGIVAIILGISFRMSGRTVTDLKVKNDIARMTQSYNNELSHLLSTSYIDSNRYTTHLTELQSGNSAIHFIYSGMGALGNSGGITKSYDFTNLIIKETTPLSPLIITRKPYQLGCLINNDEEVETGGFVLETKQGSHQRCFTIINDTCKLKQIACTR